MDELKCTCGHPEDQHIDNEVQCVIPECGCKEFELKDSGEDFSGSDSDSEPDYGDEPRDFPQRDNLL